MKFKKIFPRLLLTLLILGIAIFVVPTLIADRYAKNRIYTLENAPSASVAIVFGAGLTRSGAPTPILKDRVATAAQLYFDGKVEKLLMSGDNRFVDYNEPGAMRDYAIDLGVPAEDIVLDYAGRRTYDTCYRARHIFNVTQAVLVTQDYHLPRALITCTGLGIQALGVSADQRTYSRRSLTFWSLREVPATTQAFIDVYLELGLYRS